MARTQASYGSRNVNIRKKGKAIRQGRPAQRPKAGPGRTRTASGTTKRYRGEARPKETEAEATRRPAGGRPAAKRGTVSSSRAKHTGDTERGGQGPSKPGARKANIGDPQFEFDGGDRPLVMGTSYAGRPRSGSFSASRARDRDRLRDPASDLECIDCGNTFRNSGEYNKHVGTHNRA